MSYYWKFEFVISYFTVNEFSKKNTEYETIKAWKVLVFFLLMSRQSCLPLSSPARYQLSDFRALRKLDCLHIYKLSHVVSKMAAAIQVDPLKTPCSPLFFLFRWLLDYFAMVFFSSSCPPNCVAVLPLQFSSSHCCFYLLSTVVSIFCYFYSTMLCKTCDHFWCICSTI